MDKNGVIAIIVTGLIIYFVTPILIMFVVILIALSILTFIVDFASHIIVKLIRMSHEFVVSYKIKKVFNIDKMNNNQELLNFNSFSKYSFNFDKFKTIFLFNFILYVAGIIILGNDISNYSSYDINIFYFLIFLAFIIPTLLKVIRSLSEVKSFSEELRNQLFYDRKKIEEQNPVINSYRIDEMIKEEPIKKEIVKEVQTIKEPIVEVAIKKSIIIPGQDYSNIKYRKHY